MTAMHRLLTAQHGVDLPAGKDAEYEAKRARAMKWLEKNERDLDLAVEATSAMGGVTSNPAPTSRKPARVRRKISLDDVSDDEDETDVEDASFDASEDDTDEQLPESSDESVRTTREVHRLMRLFFADDETQSATKREELEGCRNALRRARGPRDRAGRARAFDRAPVRRHTRGRLERREIRVPTRVDDGCGG